MFERVLISRWVWRSAIAVLRLRIVLHRYWYGATLSSAFMFLVGSLWLVSELSKLWGVVLMLPAVVLSGSLYFLWTLSIHTPACASEHASIVLRLDKLGIVFKHPKMTSDIRFLAKILITDQQISTTDAVFLGSKTPPSSFERSRPRL